MKQPLVREKFEWAQIWWDHAEDLRLPRVLLIGDSIACGYSARVTEQLRGKAHVDRLGTSRSINDPAFEKENRYILSEFRYTVIHFNNGLHGKHLSQKAYADALRAYVELLRELAPDAALIWATSTPVTQLDNPALPEPVRDAQVVRRNAVAARIMADFGIPTNDLYQPMLGRPELRVADGYHYNTEGQRLQAQAVSKVIRGLLKNKGEQR